MKIFWNPSEDVSFCCRLVGCLLGNHSCSITDWASLFPINVNQILMRLTLSCGTCGDIVVEKRCYPLKKLVVFYPPPNRSLLSLSIVIICMFAGLVFFYFFSMKVQFHIRKTKSYRIIIWKFLPGIFRSYNTSKLLYTAYCSSGDDWVVPGVP